jgi:hypothetical protein
MNTLPPDSNAQFFTSFARVYLPVTLAVSSILLMAYVFVFQDLDLYLMWFEGESSLIEIITVGFAILGLIISAKNLGFRSRVSSPFFGIWMALFMLGFIYIAGEEASWGQHLFDWKTPEWISEHNRQQETNLHNLNFFGKQIDRVPKAILGAVVVITGLFWPLYCKFKGYPKNPSNWYEIYWPTQAVKITALCFFIIWLTGRIMVISDQNKLQGWNLHFSEVRELFITYFLLLYTWEFRRFKDKQQ